jgi:serine-type D-Ala-D-Ala endopeptidase (penicillin-binding protein 7)
MHLSYATLSYNNVASGHHLPTQLSVKPTNILFALGAVFSAAGALFYFGAANSATAPVAPAPAPYIKAAELLRYASPERLALLSQVALVMDERDGVMLYERAIDTPRPIASLTKLMTALVVLESDLPLEAPITITTDDRDRLKGTQSRLHIGAILTRDDLLRAALNASDNRAAAALARTAPGGTAAFVATMNTKAQALGMTHTRFADASGLDPRNVSTARDLLKLLEAARAQPRIHAFTTSGELWVTDLASGRAIGFFNTNRLVRQEGWELALSKTGYTADAGNCLVMRVTVAGRPLSIVLLNSWGKASKYGDAQRIRDWLINTERRIPLVTAHANI